MCSALESFGFLSKQKWQSCQNCIPCIQRNTSRKKDFFFEKNKILVLFPDFERKISGNCAQFSALGVKAVLYASKYHTEKVPEEDLFLFFGSLEKISICTKKLQVCQKNFFTSPGEQPSGENKTFLPPGLWSKKERLSGETWVADLPKTHSMWSEKPFEEDDCFFSRKRNFENLFWLWVEIVRNFGKGFQQGCKNRTLRVQKNILRKVFLKEGTSSYLFMVFLRNFWLEGKLQVRQEGILRVQLNISGKNFCEKPEILEFCEMNEKFQFFGKTVLAELSKPHSMYAEKHFEKIELFLDKNVNFNLFSDFGGKTSIFFGLKLGQGCQNWNLRAQRWFWKNFRKKIQFYIFSRNAWTKIWTAQKLSVLTVRFLLVQWSILRKSFGGNQKFWLLSNERKMDGFLAEYFHQSCQNFIPCAQKNTLWQMVFFEKKDKVDSIFWYWVNKFRILAEVFATGFEIEIYVTKRIFWKKFLRRKIQLNTFMVFLRTFWRAGKVVVCQKGILRVQRNIPWDNFLKKKTKNFHFSGSELLGFWRNKTCRIAKTAFRMSKKHFTKNYLFFEKKTYILLYFLFLSEKFPGFWQKFSPKTSKLTSTSPTEHSEKRFSRRRYTFISLYGFSESNLFCKETPRSPGRHCESPGDHSEWQFFVRNENFVTFEIWKRIFCVPGETRLAELPYLHSMCPGKHFRKQDFFRKKTYFWL